jgi:hypothetical protein
MNLLGPLQRGIESIINSEKGGVDNDLHDFALATDGDGDDAVRARNPLRSIRSAADIQTGSATSAHELGRGHRQKRQPRASHVLDGSRGLLSREALEPVILL